MQDDGRDLDIERQLDDRAADHSGAGISPELTRKVRNALQPSLTPVKSVPPRRRLLIAILAVFVAGSAGLIAFMGKTGLHLMTPIQIDGISAILAGGGILFAAKLVEQMIPGSRSVVPLWGLLTLGVVGAFVGLATLFPWQTSGNFISEGWPCAAMELMTVIPATALFWFLSRRGALFASGWTRRDVDRTSGSSCFDTTSSPMHVSAGASSSFLARRNGSGDHRFGALVGCLWRGRWVS